MKHFFSHSLSLLYYHQTPFGYRQKVKNHAWNNLNCLLLLAWKIELRRWLRRNSKHLQMKKKLLKLNFQQKLTLPNLMSLYAYVIFLKHFQVISQSMQSFLNFLNLLPGYQPWGWLMDQQIFHLGLIIILDGSKIVNCFYWLNQLTFNSYFCLIASYLIDMDQFYQNQFKNWCQRYH